MDSGRATMDRFFIFLESWVHEVRATMDDGFRSLDFLYFLLFSGILELIDYG